MKTVPASGKMTSPDAIGARRRRLASVDALKFISAVIVFFFHCNIHLGVQFKAVTGFISQGAVMMDLFFLLSGFAMYYFYEGRTLLDGRELHGFYCRRLVSIYPLYLVIVLSFLLVFDASTIGQKLLALPVELLLLQAWFPGFFSYSHNNGTWFLSCLMFAYLLFPLLKRFLEQAGRRLLVFLCALTYVLCATSPFIVNTYALPDIYSNPLLRLLQFAEGMALSALLSRSCEKPSKRQALLGAVTAAVSGVALAAIIGKLAEAEWFIGQYVSYGFVTLPLFMLLIAGTAVAELGSSPREPFNTVLKNLSAFAYPMFLAQFFVWNPVAGIKSAYPQLFVSHGNWKTLLLAASICAVSTLILRFWIDIPCQRLLKKALFNKPSSRHQK